MTIKFRAANTDVKMDLPFGVYLLDRDSATGKTYLNKCLKEAWLSGNSVDGYTYNDMLRGTMLSDYIKNRKLNCLMLDRYDMYIDKFHDTIEDLRKTCIVLIDCKGELNIEYDFCSIIFSDHSIEVVSDEVYF